MAFQPEVVETTCRQLVRLRERMQDILGQRQWRDPWLGRGTPANAVAYKSMTGRHLKAVGHGNSYLGVISLGVGGS